MIVGTVLMIATASLFIAFNNARAALFLVGGLSLNVVLVGIGLFESTAIQCGMDQLLEASSEQLSTFIHWYYWSCNLGRLIVIYDVSWSSTNILAIAQSWNLRTGITRVYGYLHPYYFTGNVLSVVTMGILQLVSAIQIVFAC